MCILNAAADLIAHYGYDKTTVEDIAREAGVSKGAIYLHFRSKEDLFEALLLHEAERMIDRLVAWIDTDKESLTIFSLYTTALGMVADRPLLKALYTHDRRVMGDYLRRIRQSPAFVNTFSFGTEVMQQFQQAGLLRRDVRPEVLAYILTLVRYGLFTVEEVVPIEPPPLDEIVPVLADVLQRGLAPAEKGDSEAGKQALQTLVDLAREFVRQRRESLNG
jgi:AcrR family transcriptional regulator